jgi:hypothetical protein
LCELLADAGRRQQLGSRLQEHVRRHHSPQAMLPRLGALYARLLEGRPPSNRLRRNLELAISRSDRVDRGAP